MEGSPSRIAEPLRRQDPGRSGSPSFLIHLWHAMGLLFWDSIFCLLNRVELFGEGNIPARGERGVIFLSNHISAIDPFLIGVTAMPFFSPVWWRAPAKEELFTISIIRIILRSWGGFPVRRGSGDSGAISKITTLLPSSVFVIHPEGTRSRDGHLQRGKAGVGKIIYDARPRKVIPVAIKGTDLILPKGRILPRVGKKAQIIYGKPLDLSRYYAREPSRQVAQEIVDEVMAEIARLLALLH